MKSVLATVLIAALIAAALFYARSLDDGSAASEDSDSSGEPDVRIIFPEDLPPPPPGPTPSHRYVPPDSKPVLEAGHSWRAQQQIEYAQEDMVRGLGLNIEPAHLQPIFVTQSWPSAALGCPEPDMMYATQIVRGARIIFEIDKEFYAYHASQGGVPFFCPSDRSQHGLNATEVKELQEQLGSDQ